MIVASVSWPWHMNGLNAPIRITQAPPALRSNLANLTSSKQIRFSSEGEKALTNYVLNGETDVAFTRTDYLEQEDAGVLKH